MTKFNPPLPETHPHLVSEWNDERDISTVTAGSKYRAWWKCKQGHEWDILVFYRTHYQNNCPYCSNKKILVGYNDLATTHPHLIEEWADDRPITEFTQSSKKKVRWVCLDYNKHFYYSSVQSKLKSVTGCSHCFGRTVFEGFNDLMTTHPEIASEWDYERNHDTPEEVSAGSSKKRHWVCSKTVSINEKQKSPAE